MKTKSIITTCVLAITMGLFAQTKQGKNMQMQNFPCEYMIKELKLNPKQVDQLIIMNETYCNEKITLRKNTVMNKTNKQEAMQNLNLKGHT